MNNLHKDTCYDLAEAKGTLFVEVPLGSVWLRKASDNGGNVDVITVKPSYTRFMVDIYEVKVSRSDFLQDIKSKKYEKYLPYCHRLYFAVLKGIADKSEIPAGIGLLVKGEKGWATIKSATRRDVNIPSEMLLSLAFFKGRIYAKRRMDLSYHTKSTTYKRDLKGFSRKVREAILNYENLKLKFSNLLYEAKERIVFSTDDERKEFVRHWKNLNYIY